MKLKTLSLAAVGALAFVAPALAHHSFAMFDAEQTITLLMALARHIPAADAHVRSAPAKWQRTKFVGCQLAGKTLGVDEEAIGHWLSVGAPKQRVRWRGALWPTGPMHGPVCVCTRRRI